VWGPTGLSPSEQASYDGWTTANELWIAGTPLYTNVDVVYCPDPQVVSAGLVGVLPGITPTVGNVLALWAYSEVQWTPPSVGTSPPLADASVVNLPTYLYLNGTPANPAAWQQFHATVTAGTVSATVTAIPEKVVWTAGDGGSVTCPSQGVPYNSAWGNSQPPVGSGACTYTYTTTGTYTLSATVWYHATWTSVNAGGAGGDLGLVPGPTVTEQITVQQIASVITAG
jgi:hypothetical protein